MSPLQEAVLFRMRLRWFAAKTFDAYFHALEELCRFYRWPLETLTCTLWERQPRSFMCVRTRA